MRDFRPEPTSAEKLTSKIEGQLRRIEDLRSEIKHHEERLVSCKNDLMTLLLNHQSATHDLEKELAVPNQAH